MLRSATREDRTHPVIAPSSSVYSSSVSAMPDVRMSVSIATACGLRVGQIKYGDPPTRYHCSTLTSASPGIRTRSMLPDSQKHCSAGVNVRSFGCKPLARISAIWEDIISDVTSNGCARQHAQVDQDGRAGEA